MDRKEFDEQIDWYIERWEVDKLKRKISHAICKRLNHNEDADVNDLLQYFHLIEKHEDEKKLRENYLSNNFNIDV